MRSPNVWSAAMKNQTASLKIASPIAAEVERIRQLPLPPPRRTGPSSLDSHDRPSSSAPSSFNPSAIPHRPRIKEVGRLPASELESLSPLQAANGLDKVVSAEQTRSNAK